MKRSGPNYVGTIIKLVEPAEVLGTVKHREWSSRLDGGDARDLPAAKHLPVHAVVPAKEPVAGSDRQIDYVGKHGAVANVERRGAAIRSEIVAVIKPSAFAGRAEERRAIVDGLPDGVRTFEVDTVASLIPGRGDGTAIVGIADVHASSDCAEKRVRENLIVWRTFCKMLSRILYHWRRLVLVDEQTQLVGGRTLVIDFEREGTPELALNAEAVLVDVRATKVLIF